MTAIPEPPLHIRYVIARNEPVDGFDPGTELADEAAAVDALRAGASVDVQAVKYGTPFTASLLRTGILIRRLVIEINGYGRSESAQQARAYAKVLEAAAALHDAAS